MLPRMIVDKLPAAVAVPDSSDEELIPVPGAQAPSHAAQAPIGFSDGPGLMAGGLGVMAEGWTSPGGWAYALRACSSYAVW